MVSNLVKPFELINSFLNEHNILWSFGLTCIFTIFFMVVYYMYVISKPPKTKKEYVEDYTPLAFSMFTMFYKIISSTQDVKVNELSNVYLRSLLSFFNGASPVISLLLIVMLISIRSKYFMNLSLSLGWFISIVSFMCISIIYSKHCLTLESATTWCVSITSISFLIGIVDYFISYKNKDNSDSSNHNHHRVASAVLMSYSITFILFMILLGY